MVYCKFFIYPKQFLRDKIKPMKANKIIAGKKDPRNQFLTKWVQLTDYSEIRADNLKF